MSYYGNNKMKYKLTYDLRYYIPHVEFFDTQIQAQERADILLRDQEKHMNVEINHYYVDKYEQNN